MIKMALVVLGAILVLADRQHAIAGYAAAYFAALGVALGALVWLQIAHVTRARWLLPVRRQLENTAGLLPVLALLFVPILVARADLYPWAHARGTLTAPLTDGLLPACLHAAVAFALWTAVAELLRAWSRRADTHPSEALVRRQRRLAAGALPFVGLTLTIFAFDFLMTLDPGFRSTIYGLVFFSGAGVSGLAIAAVAAAFQRARLPHEVGTSHFFALAKMLLAMVMFWTYIQLSQLILVWSGNLPVEVGWYATRIAGPWRTVTIVVVIACFALPFVLLLSRPFKRRPERVAAFSLYLVVTHALDVGWLVLPPLQPRGPAVADLGAFFVLGGVLLVAAALRARGAAAYPLNAPDLARALAFEDA